MRAVILFLMSLLIIGCSKENNPVASNTASKFGIYFLEDPAITIKSLLNKDISQLKLKEVPWISAEDIEFYDWSSHCIYLKNNKTSFFPLFQGNVTVPDSWNNKPFILVADGKVCFAGYFQLTSIFDHWPFPDISDMNTQYFPDDVIYLHWPYFPAKDERININVKNTLSDLNLLHEGLSVTVDSMWIDNADTATVRYKYTVKNVDSDNLYVLDSDKMGTELFHYFTNGPIFYNYEKNILYESKYKVITKPTPFDYYDQKWFTKIESGKSIVRMLTLKGYPRLPAGEYYVKFMFNNPVTITRQNRLASDGRYWLGYVSTATFMIYIDN